MQVNCAKTGIIYESSPNFSGLTLSGEHPIFRAKNQVLIKQFQQWTEGKVDNESAKLLFLALINSTDLLNWTGGTIAMPEIGVVSSCMSRVFNMTMWIDKLMLNVSFPQYHVTKETADFKSFVSCLKEWESIRHDFNQGTDVRHRKAVTEQKIARVNQAIALWLKKSIGDVKSRNKDAPIPGFVVDWVLDSCGLEESHPERERIKRILRIPLSRALELNINILIQLDDWFASKLEQGSDASYAVLRHLRALKKANEESTQTIFELIDTEGQVRNVAQRTFKTATGEDEELTADSFIGSEPQLFQFNGDKIKHTLAKIKWKQRKEEIIKLQVAEELDNNQQQDYIVGEEEELSDKDDDDSDDDLFIED